MSSSSSSPMEDSHKAHHMRKSTKQTKSSSRSSKRSSPPHEHSAVVMDGRHKRVWKACERCRMKKTKCDGESPCKRCKDDGLVCTAGSRKKTEFKQLPRGYAEVLENTQYALIATVQKLYTMIRNNESWDLGEPELNDRGQPVIHDIASRLGCIRPSPDLPYAFSEGAEDFAELQAQLQSSEDAESRKHEEEASYPSPAPARTERASSSESDHSDLSKEYNQMLWAQQQSQRQTTVPKANLSAVNATNIKSTPINHVQPPSLVDDGSVYSTRTSLDTAVSLTSPIYNDLKLESPMIRTNSPFSPWTGGDDFLGQTQALDLTALYMRQQQQFQPLPGSFADGTIRPNMLDCRNPYEMDQMDSIMYTGDYELSMGMA